MTSQGNEQSVDGSSTSSTGVGPADVAADEARAGGDADTDPTADETLYTDPLREQTPEGADELGVDGEGVPVGSADADADAEQAGGQRPAP